MCSTVNNETQTNGRTSLQKPPKSVADLIGEWGPWQLRTVLLIFLCKIPAAWFMACLLFAAPFAKIGEYRCKQTTLTTTHSMMIYPDAIATGIAHPTTPNGEIDVCHVYRNKTLEFSTEQLQDTEPCNAFEHHSVFKSLVTQFDLVCSRTILIAVTQFFHLCGVLTGGIFATKLLDYVSPRYVMLIGMITQIIFGCLTGLVNNFSLHIFFRYLAAVCCAFMYTPGLMIFADITGGKYRKTVICLFETFWGVGIILLPVVAIGMPFWDWKSIYMGISLPTIVYIFVWFLIPDSPKWLISHNKLGAAKNQVLYAVRVNNRSDQMPTNIDSFLQLEAAAVAKAPKPDNWPSLWSSKKQIVLMIALHTAWAADVTNYNGMLLNIRVFGRDYLIINTIVCGVCEIVGVFCAWIIVMNATKRKFLCSGLFNVIAGATSFLGFAFPNTFSEIEYVTLGMTLAMLSKIATTCSQAVLFTCTSELVSTSKQKICMFSCIVWARIWLLTTPFVGVFTFLHNLFPLAAFGFIELCGGICSCIVYFIHVRSISQRNFDKNSNVVQRGVDNPAFTATHM